MTESFLAAASATHVVHDKASNLKKIQALVKRASDEKIRLLVLPEGVLQGFRFHVDHCFDPEESQYLWANTETIPGPSTDLVSEWAKEYEISIVFGMWERVDHPASPIVYNSAVLIGPDGYIGKYRKVHQPSEEVNHYRPGNDWPVFATPLAHLGMMICYDQCFPESARELTLRGAEVLIVPNAWPMSDQASNERYDFFGRARAAENSRWLLQSNQVGSSDTDDFEYLGHSRIIDPTGMVVAQTPYGEEGLAVAEIQPVKFDPSRARSGWYLHQRVPSTYTSITDTLE